MEKNWNIGYLHNLLFLVILLILCQDLYYSTIPFDNTDAYPSVLPEFLIGRWLL